MTDEIVFNNELKSAKAEVILNFSLKNSSGSNDAPHVDDILNIDLHTPILENSIIYNINKKGSTFIIKVCNVETIKRLQLKNEFVKFQINTNTEEIPISVNLFNLMELGNAGIHEIRKIQGKYTVCIDFQLNVENSEVIVDLMQNLTTTDGSIEIDDKNDIESLKSELSSVSSNSNNANSSTPLLSKPNHKSTSLRHYLNKGRLLKVRQNSNSPGSETRSTTPSNTSSPATSAVDLSSMETTQDDTDGFLIIQIESATGLPPFRNSTHLTYDMDPFVVLSFSKQIFKTKVCRHALNPSWKNQFINVRVSKYSLNFQLNLAVYDSDLLAANDDVCYTSINIDDLIKESECNADDLWTYKSLPLKFSDTSIMKSNNSINLSDYSPQISFRFKYVTKASMQNLKHDFNPMKTKCPYCGKTDKRHSSSFQHLSICKLNLKPKQFLHKSYATSNNASRRWYAKILAHIAYGRLTIGGNNAHILVQDRETGLVLEEKISAFVKLGIRLLYKSVKTDNSSEKIKRMLRILSIKQGKRYDHPNSKSKIAGFVKFHGLEATLKDCLVEDLSKYRTFNDFFSRKLKEGVRPIEGGTDNRIVNAIADSRLIVFDKVNEAKQLWIKGSGFSVSKLLGKTPKNQGEEHAIAIFRLAPQDYHRVHCPLNGKIVKINHIHGTYYTVNPMAVRSELDVFGENIRCVISLETEEYDTVEIVMVGAMMVGSILLSVNKGDDVIKGQELGYFKFGGSTVVLVFKKGDKNIVWDADLIYNSNKRLETLVKVGMSVGHSVDSEQFKRHLKHNVSDEERIAVIRRVTGIGEGYGYGVGVSENIKSKLNNMIDDVISITGSGKASIFGADRNIDDAFDSWEMNELTTLNDPQNDNENLTDAMNSDDTSDSDVLI
ncbi:hypothetical protein CANINC_002562 [Pichia inconspicua]|uniref:phosphatidylserine decarboxylase n=1 Tax=Pichia inconspicua TaxID=52247 RepID=A0A4T0X111_9ASCO|nr:hypothetical protein CANINC_002562 [[Candida] inconspicua]